MSPTTVLLVSTLHALLLLLFATCGLLFIFGGFRDSRFGVIILLVLALAIMLLHAVST